MAWTVRGAKPEPVTAIFQVRPLSWNRTIARHPAQFVVPNKCAIAAHHITSPHHNRQSLKQKRYRECVRACTYQRCTERAPTQSNMLMRENREQPASCKHQSHNHNQQLETVTDRIGKNSSVSVVRVRFRRAIYTESDCVLSRACTQ